MNDIKKITKELSIHMPNDSDNLRHVQMILIILDMYKC